MLKKKKKVKLVQISIQMYEGKLSKNRREETVEVSDPAPPIITMSSDSDPKWDFGIRFFSDKKLHVEFHPDCVPGCPDFFATAKLIDPSDFDEADAWIELKKKVIEEANSGVSEAQSIADSVHSFCEEIHEQR